MKSILISIKPRFVAKILNGEKTIEIRKTCPEIFKHLKPYEGCSIDVYIYCTKDNSDGYLYYSFGKTIFHDKYVLIKEYDKQCIIGNGKVVAKFTLNRVEEIAYQRVFERNPFHYLANESGYGTETLNAKEFKEKSCLTDEELVNYLNVDKPNAKGYAWHISNLVIFDRPKELGEFKTPKCIEQITITNKKPIYICVGSPLTKAPQSYQFIEVEGDK